MTQTADVVVAGGGVMGLTSAWRLAQRGIKVTLVEANRCGGGASSAALGALWPPAATNRGKLQSLHRESLWGFETFASELTQASGIAVEYLRQGRIEILSSQKARENSEKEAAAAVATWPTMAAHPVMEVLTTEGVSEREPAAVTCEWGGLWCKLSAQVGVEKLIAALREACRRAGVNIMEQTAMEKIAIVDGKCVGIHLKTGSISSGKVLLTTGVHTGQFNTELAASAPIHPVRGQALLLNTDKQIAFSIIKNGKIFLVPWPDGRILVGSTTEPEAGFDCFNTVDGVTFLLAGAAATCPALAEARVEKIWAGLRPSGPLGRPVFGPVPNIQGLFFAGGHFKIGIGMAPITGEIMADLVEKGRSNHDVASFAPGEFCSR